MRLLLAFALFGLSVPSLAQHANDPLRRLQNAALAYARINFQNEFSDPPTGEASVGMAFKFSAPLASARSPLPVNYLSSGRYEYLNGEIAIYLDNMLDPLDVFEPAAVRPRKSYSGQTALGRKMNVRSEVIEKVGITIVNVPSSSSSRWQPGTLKYKAFRHSLAATPDLARRLSSSLRYEITGKITSFDDGRAVKCRSGDSTPPTLDRPIDFTYHFCTVAVAASEIILKDGYSGAILKRWNADEIAAHRPS